MWWLVECGALIMLALLSCLHFKSFRLSRYALFMSSCKVNYFWGFRNGHHFSTKLIMNWTSGGMGPSSQCLSSILLKASSLKYLGMNRICFVAVVLMIMRHPKVGMWRFPEIQNETHDHVKKHTNCRCVQHHRRIHLKIVLYNPLDRCVHEHCCQQPDHQHAKCLFWFESDNDAM